MYGQNEVRLCCPTLRALWYYTQLSLSPRTQPPSHLSHQELCHYTAAQEKPWNTGLSSRVQWGLTRGAALWKRGVTFCRKKVERSMKSQCGASPRERSSIYGLQQPCRAWWPQQDLLPKASSLPNSCPQSLTEKTWISWPTPLRQCWRVSHIFCVGDHMLGYFGNINHWLWSETINSHRSASWRRKQEKSPGADKRVAKMMPCFEWAGLSPWLLDGVPPDVEQVACSLSAFNRDVQKKHLRG